VDHKGRWFQVNDWWFASDEEKQFYDSVFGVAQTHFAAKAYTWHGHEPVEHLPVLASHRLLGLILPERYGARGLPPIYTVMAADAAARVCPDTADLIKFTSLGPGNFIAKLGSEALGDTYLPGLIAGKWILGMAISEPQAGSAANEIRTRAVRHGSEFIINGNKVFPKVSPHIKAYIVSCIVDDAIGLVVVDVESEGFAISRVFQNMSGGEQCEITFKNCRVPVTNLLASGKEAFRQQWEVYNYSRIAGSAFVTSLAAAALERAWDYLATIHRSGKPLSDSQPLQWLLADLTTRNQAARDMVVRTLREKPGLPDRLLVSMSKLFATETAEQVIGGALQVFGAEGCADDHPVGYLLRIVRGAKIYSGTSQIHMNMIAAEITKRLNRAKDEAARPGARAQGVASWRSFQ